MDASFYEQKGRPKSLKLFLLESVYPFLDVVICLQLWSNSLARSLARPKFPDDKHVGDSHNDDGQEEENGRDEAVVSGA